MLSTVIGEALQTMMLRADNSSGVDPLTDPKHDINNPLRYLPETALNAVGTALFFVTGVALLISYFKSPYRARYMLTLIVGIFCMTFGLGMRFTLQKNPDSRGLYIIMDLFVVLSPCAFIASNYILMGRIARQLRSSNLLLVNPLKITRIFVFSDVFTFLMQATGGSLTISNNINTAITGKNIFLAGLSLQLASYSFFTIVFLTFLFRVRSQEPEMWTVSVHERPDGTPREPGEYRWYKDWRALSGALALSCVGILIRCVYRTIEFAQGYVGPLATNEHTFYGLDGLPLFIATIVYVFFWPGRFIDQEGIIQHERSLLGPIEAVPEQKKSRFTFKRRRSDSDTSPEKSADE